VLRLVVEGILVKMMPLQGPLPAVRTKQLVHYNIENNGMVVSGKEISLNKKNKEKS
jgi:hypothetical protein